MDLPATQAEARRLELLEEMAAGEARRKAAAERRAADARARREAWWRWLRLKQRAVVARVAPGWAVASESGRTRFEQLLVDLYYETRARLRGILLAVALTAVAVLAWPWLEGAWRSWLLSQPPETTGYFDDRNVWLSGLRVPAPIDAGSTTGAAELAWIRGAALHRLAGPAALSEAHTYRWRDGRPYTFTYRLWEEAVAGNAPKRCLCGAHLGLPFHVVAYGQRRWAEPRVLAWQAAGHELALADALAEPGETTPVASAARILSIAHAGLSRQEVGAAEATCVLRCARWAEAHGGLPPLE